MKQITTPRTTYITEYEAMDGTIFSSKEECEKYEKTAEAVIKGAFFETFKIEKSPFDTPDEYLFPDNYPGVGSFSSGDRVFAVIIDNEDELTIFNKFLQQSCYKPSALGASAIHQIHVLTLMEDNEYWYMGTLDDLRRDYNDVVNHLNNIAVRRFKQEDNNAAEKKADSEQV